MMLKLIIRYSKLLAILWALVILVLCAMPGQYIPSVSFLELLSFDKWVHAAMFFVLFTLIQIHQLNIKNTTRQSIYFLIICVLYGVSLEVMQGLVFSNRSAEWQDIVANTFGCLIAFVFRNRLANLVLNRPL